MSKRPKLLKKYQQTKMKIVGHFDKIKNMSGGNNPLSTCEFKNFIIFDFFLFCFLKNSNKSFLFIHITPLHLRNFSIIRMTLF